MSKVFIVNHSGYPYDKAKSYGELIIVTQGYTDFTEYDELLSKLQSHIETSSPEDYLLLSGNNLLCVMAFKLWMDKHNKCNILHWRRDKDAYISHEFTTGKENKEAVRVTT